MRLFTVDSWVAGAAKPLAWLLLELGPEVAALRWRNSFVEFDGAGDEDVVEAADGVSTWELLRHTTPDVQVVDGRFDGYSGDALVVRLEAVGGESWEVNIARESMADHFLAARPDAVEVFDVVPGAA